MILYQFTMGDVEDPYLYASFPISEWQQTEEGQWIMDNAQGELTFHVTPDMNSLGYKITITGELNPEAATFFRLKYK